MSSESLFALSPIEVYIEVCKVVEIFYTNTSPAKGSPSMSLIMTFPEALEYFSRLYRPLKRRHFYNPFQLQQFQILI